MKILLIEDSRFQRIANERALVKAGYSVIQAGDGEEGLRVARKDIPDLILFDMMLPKVSGLDVLRLPPTRNSVPEIGSRVWATLESPLEKSAQLSELTKRTRSSSGMTTDARDSTNRHSRRFTQ